MEVPYSKVLALSVKEAKLKSLCAALRALRIEAVNNLVDIVEGVPDEP